MVQLIMLSCTVFCANKFVEVYNDEHKRAEMRGKIVYVVTTAGDECKKIYTEVKEHFDKEAKDAADSRVKKWIDSFSKDSKKDESDE